MSNETTRERIVEATAEKFNISYKQALMIHNFQWRVLFDNMSDGDATAIELPRLCTFKVAEKSMERVKENINKQINTNYERLGESEHEAKKQYRMLSMTAKEQHIDIINMKLQKLKDNEAKQALNRISK